jgi:hypothetical protein
MCYNCYHRSGRNKKAWACEHKDKQHCALGYCLTCYYSLYRKEKPDIIKKANRKHQVEKRKSKESDICK